MSFLRHGQIYQSDVLAFTIVLMSLQPAIPWRFALLHCPPPLHQPVPTYHPPVETANHHLARAGEFSTGRMRNFQPELTGQRPLSLMKRESACKSEGSAFDFMPPLALHLQ